jgi:hypothetical protein
VEKRCADVGTSGTVTVYQTIRRHIASSNICVHCAKNLKPHVPCVISSGIPFSSICSPVGLSCCERAQEATLGAELCVSFRMVDGRDELNHGKRNLPSQHTSFESKGLQQHVEYQFWVTASTRVGEGQSSRVVAQVPTVRGERYGHCCGSSSNSQR